MILHYFKRKENKEKQLAEYIYKKTLYQSNLLLRKNNFFKVQDYTASFEIVSIILIIYIKLNISFKIKNYRQVNEYLVNTFILDLDESLRVKGIGDMSIGKYVKSYVKKFYFRLSKFPRLVEEINNTQFLNYLNNFEFIKIENQEEASKAFLKVFNEIKVKFNK